MLLKQFKTNSNYNEATHFTGFASKNKNYIFLYSLKITAISAKGWKELIKRFCLEIEMKEAVGGER